LLAGLRAERELLSDATTLLDREMEAAIFSTLKDEFVGRSLFVSLHRTRLASVSTES
jgi:ABC-type multidrug transport system fused ATPase/permease subunit